MSTNTTNLNLFKYDPTTDGQLTFNIETALNANWDKIDADASKQISKTLVTAQNDFIVGSGNGTVAKKTLDETKTILGVSTLNKLPTTTGTSTAFVVDLDDFTLYAGARFSAKFHTAGTGSPTVNVEGTGVKALKKGDGSTAFLPKSGGAYTFIYDGVNFQLQGEGASGNAVASDLLAGKTASTDAGEIIGTMPSKTAQTYTPSTVNQTILSNQYLSGAQTILGDADLVASKIPVGVNIFNVAGTYTSDANAVASEIANGKTAYVNGAKLTGTSTAVNKASGSTSVTALMTVPVTGLSFRPKTIIVEIWKSGYPYHRFTMESSLYQQDEGIARTLGLNNVWSRADGVAGMICNSGVVWGAFNGGFTLNINAGTLGFGISAGDVAKWKATE